MEDEWCIPESTTSGYFSLTEEKCRNFMEWAFVVLSLRSFRSCGGIYFLNMEWIQIDSRAGWFFLGKKEKYLHGTGEEKFPLKSMSLDQTFQIALTAISGSPCMKSATLCDLWIQVQLQMLQLTVQFKIWHRETYNCLFSKVCCLVGFILNEHCGKYEETDVNF